MLSLMSKHLLTLHSQLQCGYFGWLFRSGASKSSLSYRAWSPCSVSRLFGQLALPAPAGAMVSPTRALALLACLASGHALAVSPRDAPSYVAHPERAAAVKEAFDRSWDGYYKYAFPHDSLRPISKGFSDELSGWGASAIDALSTAIMMGDEKVISQVLDYIPHINYDKVADPAQPVSLFETTIRHLGGLLSAHDLLSEAVASKFVTNTTNLSVILDQAVHLADNLKVAFDTPSGVPVNGVLFQPPRLSDDTTNGLAAMGTLVLEWTRLSDKTGKKEYAELAQKGESYLLNPQPKEVAEPYPGLLGSDVYVRNGSFANSRGGWNGGTDSYYEYLIKMYVYDTARFGAYKDAWIVAADSSIKHLASHPSTRSDITFLAAYRSAGDLTYRSGHLACFDGGNFVLGGLVLDRPDYVDFGLQLTHGCHETYAATATGIGPEGFGWQVDHPPTNLTQNPGPPADQADFYRENGFWITSGGYALRPEVIESFYYAYRATGDPKYQDWAWAAFKSINATCSAGVGFSEISSVNTPGGGDFADFQDSFWFAEVLKYSYLIQAEEAPWQISANHNNKFVFNTEAHPVKVAGKPI